MNRIFYKLALPVVLGGAICLTSCQEKQKPAEKTETKTETTTTETAKPADTLAAEIPAAADTAATETTETAPAGKTSGPKFGHLNSADLIEIMPETKRAEASLKAYVSNLEKQMGGLQLDYQKKIAEFQSADKSMVDAIRASKIQAIQKLEMQLQESQAAGQEKIAAKRAELFKPILEKAEKAVKAVGKENGFDYVFDTNSGGFVYTNDSHDIMPLVKKKLGLK